MVAMLSKQCSVVAAVSAHIRKKSEANCKMSLIKSCNGKGALERKVVFAIRHDTADWCYTTIEQVIQGHCWKRKSYVSNDVTVMPIPTHKVKIHLLMLNHSSKIVKRMNLCNGQTKLKITIYLWNIKDFHYS